MSVLQSVILGIVQGLTEFLPVSSSGHLLLFGKLLGVESQPLVFDIILHVGTLSAVVIVFHKDIWNMLRHPLSKPVRLLVLATIPAVIFTLLFNKFVEASFEGTFLGFGFILTAVILFFADRKETFRPRKFSHMGASDALIMGGMQAVAILPGVSRSGSTIAGGLFAGLDRQLAARFGFLMSIPAILGSLVFKFKDFMELGSGDIGTLAIVLGLLAALVTGIFAIKFMMKMVAEKKLSVFAIYVLILGAFVVFDQLVTNILFVNPF